MNFISAPLVGLLSTCDAVSDSEVLVYGVGTVKLLASNSELRLHLIESGILPFLSSLLDHYSQQQVRQSHSLNKSVFILNLNSVRVLRSKVTYRMFLFRYKHTLHILIALYEQLIPS